MRLGFAGICGTAIGLGFGPPWNADTASDADGGRRPGESWDLSLSL